MVAVPLPIPPPPITRPGGWDPSQTDPLGGPTIGQVWSKLKDALGVKPDTKAEPRVEAREADCSQTSNQNQCNSCKLTRGWIVPANYTIPYTQYPSFDYQIRIANMRAAPEHFDFTYGGTQTDRIRAKLLRSKEESITVSEWLFEGIRFDGFWRSACTVIEAKADYDFMFTSDGQIKSWVKKPTMLVKWVNQMTSQKLRIDSAGSPAKLEWHFMTETCFAAARVAFGYNASLCRLTP
ncbi:hypothetical protein DXO170_02160 [Xanthomonas oryzae pv. oryzae]|uniref:Tox-REase-5 domain-containing protein n=1 Tax=Xanthomonas oryzae TaxID=347 RepID=UPI0006550887|nr:Tox-REase-5 domain-containing protein [Xanthomonas oryzae]AKO20676.1 hypothetical protein ACU11_15580 [Xanthomonas oryzae pv. oryzicola]OLH88199.1 hypothetical protein DXO170_02160 [Xanthomonas oryzae pv. oryzae]OLI41351.1 hypothetical protein IXO141_15455 [Xanthomonas oryzae pv. oryzae]OLI89339.1 hypothetical protein IXO390_19745 [Xanthomonas oryzae pv. oryzae]PUE89529.1 hypothetical protein C7T79_22520 [Xanthomonas oryzae pv. oryzicola]